MSWHPGTIGEAVRAELSRFGAPAGLGAVVAAWPDAVGAAIAENAWPARVTRDGTLVVTTSSSVWAFELTKLEAQIGDRLRRRLGDAAPARLRFAAGRLPERGPAESAERAARAAPTVTPEARRAGEAAAAAIADPELRALVARAAAASLTPRPREAADRSLWYH